MAEERRGAAVCVIRVDSVAGRALITVTSNPDIERTAADTVAHFGTVEPAIRAVTDFLTRAAIGRVTNR